MADAKGASVSVIKRQVKIPKGQAGSLTFELFNLHRGGTSTIEVEGFKGTASTGKKALPFNVVGG